MSGANRSTAVMQLRRTVAPDALDYFPTPPWATRALCEWLVAERGPLNGLSCWEPACGEGHMKRPLAEYFRHVWISDVHRYLPDQEVFDFTQARMNPALSDSDDFVITNPPFRLAFDFIQTAATVARVGFAMLVRSAFLEGADRFGQLYSRFPPDFVLQFSERVVMLEGRLVRAGDVDPFAAEEGRKASTATSYAWLVWMKGSLGDTRLRWIGPCRTKLERPGDYPDYAKPAGPPAEGLFESLSSDPSMPTGAAV
jgi:hypothetical protein